MATHEYKTKKLRDQGYSERDAVLINMKRSNKPKEVETAVMPEPPPADEYPYGLKLDLDDESLDKLGVKELKEVGTECKIVATATVESASERSTTDGTQRSLCLQITEMSIE